MNCEVAKIGNPILRQCAERVTSFDDDALHQFVDGLIAVLRTENGVGIAAPQVSVSKRIVIVASMPNSRYPNAPLMDPMALINPEITSQSDEKEKGWEGCLSVPGVRGLVPRSVWVEVEYQDLTGARHKRRFEGFVARIFQHEYDHLIGLTYLDRVEDNREIVAESEYQRMRSDPKNSSWPGSVTRDLAMDLGEVK